MSLRDERGMTVIELLVAMTLSTIIFAATLQVYDGANRSAQRTGRAVDAAERGREGMTRMVRTLRDASGWNASAGAADSVLLRAEPFDLVLGRVTPDAVGTTANPRAIETVRFCAEGGRLYEQRGPASVQPAATCPDPSWTTTSVLDDVRNAGSQPVFAYEQGMTGVTTVAMRLEIRDDRTGGPPAQVLRGGVQLRNQNQPPAPSFTAVPTAGRHVQLNGSMSSDPEGQLLEYAWKDGTTELVDRRSPVLDYIAPAAGPRTISLTVTDPSGGKATVSQVVEVLP